jgi:hypothetical protein
MPTDLISSVSDAVANNTMMNARRSINLICSDRLSDTCDKVTRVGSYLTNLITDLFNEICDFSRDFVAPIIWQAIGLIKYSLNSALSSSSYTVAIVTQQAMTWIQTTCSDTFCRAHDLADLVIRNTNNLARIYATNHPFIHRALLAAGSVIILFILNKFSRDGKTKSK